MWSDLNGDGDELIDVLPFHNLLVYCSADVTLLARQLQIVLTCTIFVIAAGRTEILWKITMLNGKIHYFYGHFQ